MDVKDSIVARFLADDRVTTTPELLKLTGFRHKRDLQDQIFRERKAGILIIGGRQGGYHLPSPGRQGRDQMERFYQTLRARGVRTLQTASFFRKAVKAYDREHSGQLQMDDVEMEGSQDAETESGAEV